MTTDQVPQDAQPSPHINFDLILDMLSVPAPIQVQFKQYQTLVPGVEVVIVNDIHKVCKRYTDLGLKEL